LPRKGTDSRGEPDSSHFQGSSGARHFPARDGGSAARVFHTYGSGERGHVRDTSALAGQKRSKHEGFREISGRELLTATMVLFLLGGSTVLGHFLAVTKIPIVVSGWVGSLPFPNWMIMTIICLIYLLVVPLSTTLRSWSYLPDLFPAVVKLGYDPIWFGIMITITIMIGIVIPPVALNVFVVKKRDQDFFRRYLQWRLSVPDRPCGLCHTALYFSGCSTLSSKGVV